MKKFLTFLLSLCLVASLSPRARAYENGQPFQADLSKWIENDDRRVYVEMMLDYYVRTDTMVQHALAGGFSAVFLFDGCSDNMDDPALQDLTYYRVTGLCIVVQLGDDGEPRIVYFNDNASTIPDRPLEIGAWWLPEAGDVGPATICDGTYQLYSVYHKGKYEALHVRTEFFDTLVDAVYMTYGSYVSSRASEINVHTRTSNHVSGTSMWSAGCPLVGDGDSWEFWKLIDTVCHTAYDAFEVGNFVGTLTVDRQGMREDMYRLYKNKDAVDMVLTNSRNAQPKQYLNTCSDVEIHKRPEERHTIRETQFMTLPCSNATDARALLLETIPEGESLKIIGSIRNSAGNPWYHAEYNGKTGYVYSGHMEKDSFADWLFEKLFT